MVQIEIKDRPPRQRLGRPIIQRHRDVQRMQRLSRLGNSAIGCKLLNKNAAAQPRIDVSRAGEFQRGESRDGPQRGHNLFGNLSGRLAQPPRQLERNRSRILAESKLRWLLQHYRFHMNLI